LSGGVSLENQGAGMKKILVVVMILVCLSGTQVFADENSKFPSSLASGNIIANVGIGQNSQVLSARGGSIVVPPLSLSVEYALPIGIPLSVGATIGFATSQQHGGSGPGKFTHTWSVFSLGGKVAYHFNWAIRGLDAYTALTLGADILNANSDYNESYFSGETAIKPSAGDDDTSVLFGLELGARFFFNTHFGVFIEEGFNTFTYLRSGLVFKF
jgi:hypothetical protein